MIDMITGEPRVPPSPSLFVVSYAGHLYGPFATADEAAEFGTSIYAPWTIIKLRQNLSDEQVSDLRDRWIKQHSP